MNHFPRLSIPALPALCLILTFTGNAGAAINYTVFGSSYTQNFDSLPNTPENTSLEATRPWADDTATGAAVSGIPGWYLYHPLSPAGENGTNDHQRFRIGAGSANTGSFYSFGSTGSTDRALGGLNADTLSTPQNATVPPATVEDTQMFIGFQIVNNTGTTLTSFSLSYAGEQWRLAGNGTGGTQVTDDRLDFQYSLNPAATISSANSLFTNVDLLDFTSPQTTGAAAGIDGNAAVNRSVISSMVTNISWAPGATLFLRWVDPNYPGPDPTASATRADNALAIDDLSFSAVPEPNGFFLLASGAALLTSLRRRRN
jgi:hypothetical protein